MDFTLYLLFYKKVIVKLFCCEFLQAEAALMYDVAKVILDAYSRLLRRNPDIFRNNFRRGEVYNNGTRGIDCRRAPVLPWEHGERIARIFKKV